MLPCRRAAAVVLLASAASLPGILPVTGLSGASGALGTAGAAAPAAKAARAPEFVGLGPWFNGAPTTLAALRGRVVLIDFWTFGCVNCQRTIPHVNALYEKHRAAGFEVIGVHAPEFAHERDASNVRRAIARAGIRFRVALDNEFRTWASYKNRYWPAFYLLDRRGVIRHTHFGEGAYAEMDRRVTALLAE